MFPTESEERQFCISVLEVKSTEIQQFWSEHGVATGIKKKGAQLCMLKQEGRGHHKIKSSILLMLCPLDALEVNTILHHLPERAHFTKTLHMLNTLLCCVIHFFLCSETADAKPDRRMS